MYLCEGVESCLHWLLSVSSLSRCRGRERRTAPPLSRFLVRPRASPLLACPCSSMALRSGFRTTQHDQRSLGRVPLPLEPPRRAPSSQLARLGLLGLLLLLQLSLLLLRPVALRISALSSSLRRRERARRNGGRGGNDTTHPPLGADALHDDLAVGVGRLGADEGCFVLRGRSGAGSEDGVRGGERRSWEEGGEGGGGTCLVEGGPVGEDGLAARRAAPSEISECCGREGRRARGRTRDSTTTRVTLHAPPKPLRRLARVQPGPGRRARGTYTWWSGCEPWPEEGEERGGQRLGEDAGGS